MKFHLIVNVNQLVVKVNSDIFSVQNMYVVEKCTFLESTFKMMAILFSVSRGNFSKIQCLSMRGTVAMIPIYGYVRDFF